LRRAEFIVPLCERFHVLPSQVLKEDAEVVRLVNIYDLAHPPES
jgi:hypothetical protein